MNEIVVHPNVYATGNNRGLVSLLEDSWIRGRTPGDGTIYIVSGFANYNGGVRFYEVLRAHVEAGGRVVAVLGGSTSQRLSSKQVVEELLGVGAEVWLINRKRILHAKCYGASREGGESLVVTSGNFTGPGMSQNVEMSVSLDETSVAESGFVWADMEGALLAQGWDYYTPSLDDSSAPAWRLVYDEQAGDIVLDETDEVTMVLTLSHADTARINAEEGTRAARGTQYFWLSKDCYDFFPALTIRNERGEKATYSAMIEMDFIDLDVQTAVRVTFEAENNLDFRLGTGQLRHSRLATEGDMAAISRVADSQYQMRLFRQGSVAYEELVPYAVNFIGHRGKKYGFLPNATFERLLGARLRTRPREYPTPEEEIVS